MKGKKRQRSESDSKVKEPEELPVKKRKRSYSGIDLPDPEEQEDDFQKFKINPAIAERLKLKQKNSLFDVQKKVFSQLKKAEA